MTMQNERNNSSQIWITHIKSVLKSVKLHSRSVKRMKVIKNVNKTEIVRRDWKARKSIKEVFIQLFKELVT